MKQKKEPSLHVVYIITKLELGGAQKVCLSLFKGVAEGGITSSLISGSEGTLVSEVAQSKQVYLLDALTREVGVGTIFSEVKAF